MNLQQVKQRFGIIGNASMLNRALEIAVQVAPTDVSVLVTGESGTGKEIMPQVIHALSSRKHGPYIAVNCGAIPEGTIDSELFGHEKGSFTGAHEKRKGYFEVADGGTIFLDEVAELPLQTQVRLLRVLETGEFLKVGSSKSNKTNVRVVAATNVNMPEAIASGRFREDLYYRLNSVPIQLPPLRERGDDIHLIFRKFASDFAEKYRMPTIQLTDDAVSILKRYSWPGNIRQLKNIIEQIAIIEQERDVDGVTLAQYLPEDSQKQLPMVIPKGEKSGDMTEREILYKILFDLKKEVHELKSMVLGHSDPKDYEHSLHEDEPTTTAYSSFSHQPTNYNPLQLNPKSEDRDIIDPYEEVEENLSLADTEKELIVKALQKHNNKRKNAAKELGISERTLYRKIKEFDL